MRYPDWPSVICTLSVADLDESLERVLSCGGVVVRPRMPIPGTGYIAFCRDTDGNVIGVMQPDPTAH